MSRDDDPLRLALVWRGDPATPPPAPARTRLAAIFAALSERGAVGEPVVYADEVAAAVRERLLGFDGVLVWVDPLSEGKDRSRLDPLLRAAAVAGVYVSAHPDVISKMGTKAVLHETRDLGWGGDVDLYRTWADLKNRFPVKLAQAGPRVLKQYRGNGGQGVWKVERVGRYDGDHTPVEVLHAQRGSVPERTSLGDFLDRCRGYFAGEGRLIDQAFQPRLPDGMIRCYLSQNEVVGFGHQLVKALIPPPPASEGPEAALPGPRIMHPPDAAPFQHLRQSLETQWLPAMQQRLDIPTASLPALWDADFLYGPRTADGRDTYVLCEINISAVAPFPDWAVPKVADAAIAGARQARWARRPVDHG